MTFEDLLDQATALLQRRGRVSYRTLQRQFTLDDTALEDLKEAILFAHPQVIDEGGRGLVWPEAPAPTTASAPLVTQPAPQTAAPAAAPPTSEAERRQLTVMFCDLADSTQLSGQLDPEDLRAVLRAYQQASVAVIERLNGYVAQYLGDGLLVYFGWPQAHEDDAQRAVHAGLGIIEAMGVLNTRLASDKGIRLAVRIGVHTGPVVVGEMGAGGRHEQLALGETPNVAARIQALVARDTVAISATTFRLVDGYFTSEDLGLHSLKGVATPMQVYRILRESGAQSRLDIVPTKGLTPLVGRDSEVAGLLERWGQVREGLGQVILLSGDAGIGKSRLLQVLKEHVAHDTQTILECRSSPYYQNTAFYPVTGLWARTWHLTRDDTPEGKLAKLEQALTALRLVPAEAVPLLAPLFALPLPAERYPPLPLSPQRQRQQTLATLCTLVLELAAQQPLLLVVEDLHWTDPSTLEWLTLLIEQVPTARICLLLTSRPGFQPPWSSRSYLTQLTLSRLTRQHIEAMIARLTGGKSLPAAVVQHLVEKTDGVPLYVEEMTKAILESGVLQEVNGQYALIGSFVSLTIPTTLHDSLMARLDRLGAAKGIAQLGATLGRQFAYEVLQAVSHLDEATVQRELGRLVEAELLYQQGIPPQATYTFKHALIQDTAYQSLLRSTRQQYHQRIGQTLEERFPETAENQPELLAHHYTEAGFREQAIGYWQQAGQQALQRSANPEAVRHLMKGLDLLATLPETSARVQQELELRVALGPAMMATKGWAAPEVEQTYARARALCQQVGETPHLVPVLRGLGRFYGSRGALRTAHELNLQLLKLAQRETTPFLLLEAHEALGNDLFFLGEYPTAQMHLEQAIALADPKTQRELMLRQYAVSGVTCLAWMALTLWCLGYPTRALRRCQEALTLAQSLAHPHSLALVRHLAAYLHQRRRKTSAVLAQAEALVSLATAQQFPLFAAMGTFWRGWALALQGQGEEGRAQIHQGLEEALAVGQALSQTTCLILLAEVAGHAGQVDEGLRLLTEALTAFEANERSDMLTEVYRLQGELLLCQTAPEIAQAEACFHQALDIARRQQARSWELRAAVSLSRLWQRQGKCLQARELLASIYNWFTEGFDTADLQEARALLEELS
jgi:class 3 adenylate cyclase/predicted ATPase